VCVVMAIATASLKVVERVGSAFGERDAVMNLEPLASTTTDAHPITCVSAVRDRVLTLRIVSLSLRQRARWNCLAASLPFIDCFSPCFRLPSVLEASLALSARRTFHVPRFPSTCSLVKSLASLD
jgi:hypothetical protein